MHGEVFYLWQATVTVCLWFEDIPPPQSYNGEAVGLVLPSPIDI